MMSTVNLTPTSYVVLGLLEQCGPSTPYDLKAAVARSIGYFWSFPHAQLYTEPPRLAAAGYVSEAREETGRRRRTFSITDQGRRALADWMGAPTPETYEVRDPGLLKLFFGDAAAPARIATLAAEQLAAHAARLEEYRTVDAHMEAGGLSDSTRLTLRFGLVYEESAVQFWNGVLADHQGDAKR